MVRARGRRSGDPAVAAPARVLPLAARRLDRHPRERRAAGAGVGRRVGSHRWMSAADRGRARGRPPSGRPRHLARRGRRAELEALSAAIFPSTGRATTIGLTGAPGVGKSTLAGALVAAAARRGSHASPCWPSIRRRRSRGARCSATGSGCRSTRPTRACSSGRWRRAAISGAWRSPRPRRCGSSTRRATTRVMVETVGVGQAEVDVAAATDTTVVVLAPGMGDAVQMAKAGILEVADVFVVNKADRDGADEVVRELRQMLHLGAARDWDPTVVRTDGDRRRWRRRALGRDRGPPRAWRSRAARSTPSAAKRLAREVEALAAERFRLESRGRSRRRARARRRPRRAAHRPVPSRGYAGRGGRPASPTARAATRRLARPETTVEAEPRRDRPPHATPPVSSGEPLPSARTGPSDVAGRDLDDALGVPGSYPFTRGVYPSMYRGRLWTMRQFAGFGTPAETNARYQFLLERGQGGLRVAFDMPTLMGLDSDDPVPRARSAGAASRPTRSTTSRRLFDGSRSETSPRR